MWVYTRALGQTSTQERSLARCAARSDPRWSWLPGLLCAYETSVKVSQNPKYQHLIILKGFLDSIKAAEFLSALGTAAIG